MQRALAMINLYNFKSDHSIVPYTSHDFCYVPLKAAATHQSWHCIILYYLYRYVLHYLSHNMLYITVLFLLLNKLSFIHSLSETDVVLATFR